MGISLAMMLKRRRQIKMTDSLEFAAQDTRARSQECRL